MFVGCSQLSTKIVFNNNAIDEMDYCFEFAATEPGSKIIVKYSGNCTKEMAQDIVATKSPNSHIYLEGEEVSASGISLNESSATLKIGETLQLSAEITPIDAYDAITWSSSNPEVAAVDNAGVVTAVAGGTTVIKVTAGSATAECNVKVISEEESSYTGLKNENGVWVYYVNGQVDTTKNGLIQYDGAWFLLANGKVNNAYKGLYTYDGAQFLVADGQILSSYNGLFQYQGEWYYIAGGQVSQYTGLALYDGAWFYIVSGILAEDYTGWVWYDGHQFYVVNGMV